MGKTKDQQQTANSPGRNKQPPTGRWRNEKNSDQCRKKKAKRKEKKERQKVVNDEPSPTLGGRGETEISQRGSDIQGEEVEEGFRPERRQETTTREKTPTDRSSGRETDGPPQLAPIYD
jgi:hypothetical protein